MSDYGTNNNDANSLVCEFKQQYNTFTFVIVITKGYYTTIIIYGTNFHCKWHKYNK